jgi:hypothetical protein
MSHVRRGRGEWSETTGRAVREKLAGGLGRPRTRFHLVPSEVAWDDEPGKSLPGARCGETSRHVGVDEPAVQLRSRAKSKGTGARPESSGRSESGLRRVGA